MQIAIRVDASSLIGAGHVMRCLTLAKALKKQGARITFLCREYKGNLIERIVQQGFSVLILSSLKNQFIDYSQKQDSNECLNALKNSQIFDLLIVDHYQLNIHWQKSLSKYYKKLFIIDDLANRQHIGDFLLDQTVSRTIKAYEKLVPHDCQMLLGNPYMLLREEFKNKKNNALNIRLNKKKINHVLITMGGMDSHNVTFMVLKALLTLKIQRNDLRVSVLLTSQALHLPVVSKLAEKYNWITVYIDSSNVAEIMLNADIAIGASGSTAWERCCLALPTLSIIDAENQILVDKSLDNMHACVSLGWYNNITEELIIEQCLMLMKNFTHYKKVASSANKVCDGKGVDRVVDKILETISIQTVTNNIDFAISPHDEEKMIVNLRPATMKDCEQVYQWQKQPFLRQYFTVPDIPTFIEHKLWFSKALSSKNHQLYIIYNQGIAVGSLRLDSKKEKSYEISILIEPSSQGKGIGLSALKQLPTIVNSATIIANVHRENKASHKLFISANFHPLSSTSYGLRIEKNKIKPIKTAIQGKEIK